MGRNHTLDSGSNGSTTIMLFINTTNIKESILYGTVPHDDKNLVTQVRGGNTNRNSFHIDIFMEVLYLMLYK